MTSPRKSRDPRSLRPATQLIHGGSLRSGFDETSEALFPHPGLSLRHDGARRGAVQGRRAGLHLFALRQSDRFDVRAAHGAARGRRGGKGDRKRHGGGDRRPDGPAQMPAITSSPPRPCSAPASMSSRSFCRGSASLRPWSTEPILTPGGRRCGQTRKPRSLNRPPIRRWRSSTSPASPRSCTRSGRRWSSTMSSPPPFTSVR